MSHRTFFEHPLYIKTLTWLRSQSPARLGLLAGILMLLFLLPSLGLTEFNTKGEPREAVVSLSMIKSGNWILPVNNDIDIPYKPMMFHWIGSLVAELTGGEVTEATARIPSGLAMGLTVGMTLWFFFRYSGRRWQSVLTALIVAGCFEINRAGSNARVDMMLTAWMLTAFYLLYRWYDRLRNQAGSGGILGRIPWLAILAMSAAVLTKGPVGAVLPCLAIGLFMLAEKENFFKSFGMLAGIGILSLVLPSLWYYAAWLQGGDAFLNLVIEENFGRMTGTMTYESHSNPWHYNLWITAAGLLPWSLLAIFGLFSLRGRVEQDSKVSRKGENIIMKFKRWWRNLSPLDCFSLISLLTIFLFFTLPDSKRSVYLMPAYPFAAWFMSRWFISLTQKGRYRAVLAYGNFISALLVIIPFLLIICGAFFRESLLEYGANKSAGLGALMSSLTSPGPILIISCVVAYCMGALWMRWKRRGVYPKRMLAVEGVLTMALFGLYNYGVQPAVLNIKSLKPEIPYIEELMPQSDGDLYEYIMEGESPAGNIYHFFELDFYLGDRIRSFAKHRPERGYLVVRPEDAAVKLQVLEGEGYTFRQTYLLDLPGRKEKLSFYRFEKN